MAISARSYPTDDLAVVPDWLVADAIGIGCVNDEGNEPQCAACRFFFSSGFASDEGILLQIGKSAKTGAYFQKIMREKIGAHPLVGEVRGVALMCGVEIVANKTKKEPLPMSLKVAPRLGNFCLEEGLISRALMGANAMAFSPPLVITESECDEIVTRFTRALNKLADALVKEGAWKAAA